jgi:hypothetical protein
MGSLGWVARQRVYSDSLRCDNGPELACDAVADTAKDRVGLSFIPPGQPWPNGYVGFEWIDRPFATITSSKESYERAWPICFSPAYYEHLGTFSATNWASLRPPPVSTSGMYPTGLANLAKRATYSLPHRLRACPRG